MAVYATTTDLVNRFDVRVLRELATDDDVPLSRPETLNSPKLQNALQRASGDVDVALLVGNRYTPAQLESLEANSREHLKDIVCTLAMVKLYQRRLSKDNEELVKDLREQAQTHIDDLRKGINIFDIVDDDSHNEASLPQVSGPTSIQIQDRNFLAAKLSHRHLPSIAERNPVSRG